MSILPLTVALDATGNFNIFEIVLAGCRTNLPQHARRSPRSEPRVEPARKSSTVFPPRSLQTQAKDSTCRSFTPTQPNQSTDTVKVLSLQLLQIEQPFHFDVSVRRRHGAATMSYSLPIPPVKVGSSNGTTDLSHNMLWHCLAYNGTEITS